MIRSLKQIKNRIRSIENTKKVTGAMEMISVAKLNRIENVLHQIRPYFSRLESILHNFINSTGPYSSPFLAERAHKNKIGLCIITSDSGLCGAYNNDIISLAEEFIKNRGKDKIKLITIGKRGLNYFKKQEMDILNSYIGLNGKYSDKIAGGIAIALIDVFLSGEVDEVYIAYSHYKTAMVRTPVIKKILNVEVNSRRKIEYILEPDKEKILEDLLFKYIFMQIRVSILEAFTSEHAARIVAMKTATDNAKELLDSLVLLRNKVRQANITQDIMEIISSSEALKG
jgi:F-type H+-transporting ATPase subunit gamma